MGLHGRQPAPMKIKSQDWRRLFELLDRVDEPQRQAWLKRLDGEDGNLKHKLLELISKRAGTPSFSLDRLVVSRSPNDARGVLPGMAVPKYVTLQVVGPKAAGLGAGAVHTFDMKGGRFGRAADNDWVINDDYVSRYQAQIGYAGGKFYISPVPKASAQMFINGPDTQIQSPQKYPLNSGDELIIDEVLIRVDLSTEHPSPTRQNREEPVHPKDDFNPFKETDPSVVDPALWAPGSGSPNDSRDDHRSDATSEAYPATDIPDKWWDRPDDTHDATGTDQPVPPAPGGATSADLLAFLEGAGVRANSVTPEVMTSLGAIVRTVVQGVVDILRARAEIKREFRMDVTLAQQDENNPLKFSANAQDALHNLFVKRIPGFLTAVPAFEEAFDDLRGHQLAMLKGLRAGFDHMLARFDPKRLEERFVPHERVVGLKGLMGGSKLWEQYRSWFAETTEDEDDCFRRLFGEEFARAYEQEMQRLEEIRRRRRAGA